MAWNSAVKNEEYEIICHIITEHLCCFIKNILLFELCVPEKLLSRTCV